MRYLLPVKQFWKMVQQVLLSKRQLGAGHEAGRTSLVGNFMGFRFAMYNARDAPRFLPISGAPGRYLTTQDLLQRGCLGRRSGAWRVARLMISWRGDSFLRIRRVVFNPSYAKSLVATCKGQGGTGASRTSYPAAGERSRGKGGTPARPLLRELVMGDGEVWRSCDILMHSIRGGGAEDG